MLEMLVDINQLQMIVIGVIVNLLFNYISVLENLMIFNNNVLSIQLILQLIKEYIIHLAPHHMEMEQILLIMILQMVNLYSMKIDVLEKLFMQ